VLVSGADDSGEPDELSGGGWLASAAASGEVIPPSPVEDESPPHATHHAEATAKNAER
jgi:hypothetical protein